MQTQSVRDPATIQSFERGLKIFEAIIASGHPLRVNEIAQQFGIDKASAHRFMTTLDRFGLVQKNPRTKEYSLGPKFLAWTTRPRVQLDLVAIAKPFLSRMAAETGQEAHLGVLAGDAVILVDTAAPMSPISIRSMIGMSEPLHCTALGKAILAFLPLAEREALLARLFLPALTPNTIVSREALRSHLDQVRSDGVATDDGEHVDILTCIASPIVAGEGPPAGSIGISLIRLSLTDTARLDVLKAKVADIASMLSKTVTDQSKEFRAA